MLPEIPIDPAAPYEFVAVNGFFYRCNTRTGETWRLEAKADDKKIQMWKLIEDASGA